MTPRRTSGRTAAAAMPAPGDLAPMLATPAAALPPDPQHWAFEYKWDGVRTLAFCDDTAPRAVRLISRNGRDVTHSYPELEPLAAALPGHSVVLDGEIVALGPAGPSFALLQQRMHVASRTDALHRSRRVPVVFMLFDVLFLDGSSLLGNTYIERRAQLEALGLAGPHWQTPPSHPRQGAAVLESARGMSLEGVIAKRLDSTYRPGERSRDWLKIKLRRSQELVIGGWLPMQGRPMSDPGALGALLVGYYQDERLRYAGRVGTGFNEESRRMLLRLMSPLLIKECPFREPMPTPPPPGSQFTRPKLVAEVEFHEWTPDGSLRHPVFKGLRNDKDPTQVVREQ